MKLLLVNDYAAALGGAELSLLALREGLRKRGHDARLFASSAAGGVADHSCFGTTSRFRTLLQCWNPLAARALRRTLLSFAPDVVHVQMFLTQLSPAILEPLRGVASVHVAVWYRDICPLGTKQLPNGSICRSPAGRVCTREGCVPWWDNGPLMLQMRAWRRRRDAFTMILANSEATRRRLHDEGIETEGVLTRGLPDFGARPPLVGPPLVGFAGRLVKAKGVDVLLRAFARARAAVPEARLRIVGSGPEEAEAKRLAEGLGLLDRVEFNGQKTRGEVEALLAPAWVQAVPSTWEEPFGFVAVEAAMRGTAVVASATGGLVEIVEDGKTGRLVPAGDVAALADALVALLLDRSLAESLGRSARDSARQRFSHEATLDRAEAVYREAQRRHALRRSG